MENNKFIITGKKEKIPIKFAGVASLSGALMIAVVEKTFAEALEIFENPENTARMEYEFDGRTVGVFENYKKLDGISAKNDGTKIIRLSKEQ